MSEPTTQPEGEEAWRESRETEMKILIDEYCQRFGEEPCWWVLCSSSDIPNHLREAIRTGQPIVLNIPPDALA